MRHASILHQLLNVLCIVFCFHRACLVDEARSILNLTIFDGLGWTLGWVLNSPLEASILLILWVVVERSPVQHVKIIHLIEVFSVCRSVVDVVFVWSFTLINLIDHAPESHQSVL